MFPATSNDNRQFYLDALERDRERVTSQIAHVLKP